ncbi:MAG: uracil-DNA glycosylase [Armatimonadetes bacterium]|nr:uracil-DNA glycosylase [Armatimonadota bacterium]
MLLERLWNLYERDVFPLSSSDTLFNQYQDADLRTERPDGPAVRQANLRSYLASYHDMPVVLVVGEAAGPWGMRWSGVPFTSERQLAEKTVPFQGEVSSLQKPAVRLGRKSPHSSGSATIFWRVMKQWFPAFLAVDVVPFFPHTKGDVLKKDTPSDSEIRQFLPILEQTSTLLQPATIVAVGRRASEALSNLGMDHEAVHHTAHDAKKEFPAGMESIFERLRCQGLV